MYINIYCKLGIHKSMKYYIINSNVLSICSWANIMFTWLIRAGRGWWPCTMGRTVLAGSHDYVHATQLDRLSGPGQPGADKRQTLLLDKGGSSSPLSKSTPPSITSQQLPADLLSLETKAAVSNCDAPKRHRSLSTWHHPRRVSGEIHLPKVNLTL